MFICFEGIAGSGKTTQTKNLFEYLKTKNKDVFVSSAYEGNRRLAVSSFMNETGIKSDQNAVMFLFQSLHAAQFFEVNESLRLGKTVIADRWSPSFYAHHLYQNTFNGDGVLMDKIDRLAFRSLEPDAYFLIDLPPDVAYSRYVEREKVISDKGLDLMHLEYFSSVSLYYKEVAQKKGWYVIDGTQSEDAVFLSIKKIIDQKLCS